MVSFAVFFERIDIHTNFSDRVKNSGYRTDTAEGLASRDDAQYLLIAGPFRSN